jgi:hypothetical protein
MESHSINKRQWKLLTLRYAVWSAARSDWHLLK